ncbi:MAG TPA: carbohydrate kinase family protein, partial [Armatimonadetes bacterium]|nr:carbohydrate kinase family protein [Armatimonadota bacterium]
MNMAHCNTDVVSTQGDAERVIRSLLSQPRYTHQSPLVIGCGALNVDYLFRVRRLVTDGETEITEMRREAGGSAANTIYALAKWGIPCAFIGCIGNDDDGQLMLQSFERVGVDTHWLSIQHDHHTGRVMGFVDTCGHRALYVLPGANLALSAAELPNELPQCTRWVHCTSLVGESQMHAQREWMIALPERIHVSFAPGAIYVEKGLDTLRPFIERATVLFVTRDELTELTNISDLSTACIALHSIGVPLIAITAGGEGSYISFRKHPKCTAPIAMPTDADEHTLHHESAIAVTVRDTTGAGDAFAAGMLLGLLHRLPLNA